MVLEWFQGLATISGFLYFLTGFAFAYVQYCVRAKIRHKRITIPWHLAGIAIGCAAIVIVSIQSSIAYNTANETAQAQKLCNLQFRSALIERSKITRENDELSQEQRRVLFDWINALIFPPEPYASMEPNDPRRQGYGLDETIETRNLLFDSLRRQDQLQKDREAHPYPDPTCGQ
jgi:hypothetical protein